MFNTLKTSKWSFKKCTNYQHIYIAKADMCSELVIDCTKDDAKEICPDKCSEPKACKLADCLAARNLEFCPITCAKEAQQGKGRYHDISQEKNNRKVMC